MARVHPHPASTSSPDPGPSRGRPSTVARPLALAVAIGLIGAAIFVLLAGGFALGAGLLVVAALIGRLVGLSLVTAPLAREPRSAAAVAIAVGSILLGLAGTWAYARWEGGVLAPADYLAETFGLLVPLELAVAAAVARWSAR